MYSCGVSHTITNIVIYVGAWMLYFNLMNINKKFYCITSFDNIDLK